MTVNNNRYNQQKSVAGFSNAGEATPKINLNVTLARLEEWAYLYFNTLGFLLTPSEIVARLVGTAFESTRPRQESGRDNPEPNSGREDFCSSPALPYSTQKEAAETGESTGPFSHSTSKSNSPFALAYQLPFPSMLPYTAVAPVSPPQPQPQQPSPPRLKRGKGHVTALIMPRYPYHDSPYFKEAERLTEGLGLSMPCLVVFALIIAWCHFPLFKGMRGRKGQWMALSLERASREVSMRPQRFNECVAQLVEAGLIERGRAGEGLLISEDEFYLLRLDATQLGQELGEGQQGQRTLWSNRSIQRKNHLYQLKVIPDTGLPLFNPFLNATGENVITPEWQMSLNEEAEAGKGLKQVEEAAEKEIEEERVSGRESGEEGRGGKDLEEILGLARSDTKEAETAWEGLKQAQHVLITASFPVLSQTPSCINVLNNDDVDAEGNKNARAYILEKELEPQKEAAELHSDTATTTPTASFSSSLTYRADQLDQLINRLKGEKRAKFDYLDRQASFEDFSTGDGRTTLARWEAYKFALREGLTLVELKLRHAQVNQMWLAGEVRKSPLALLHWAIKHSCDPRSGSIEQLEAQLQRQADGQGGENENEANRTGVQQAAIFPTSPRASSTNGSRSGSSDRTDQRGGILANDGSRTASSTEPVPTRPQSGFVYGVSEARTRRNGYSFRTQGYTSRFGNPDCTNYEEW
jgi:hypothetical protein